MSDDKKRVAERNLGLFANPGGASPSGFLVPPNSLTVGPGEPGPEDEWKFPPDPIDGATGENPQTAQPAESKESEPSR